MRSATCCSRLSRYCAAPPAAPLAVLAGQQRVLAGQPRLHRRQAQVSGHPRQHLLGPQRLGHIVDRAGAKARQLVGRVVEGGHEDHRHGGDRRGVGLQAPAHLEAVDAGQHHVQQDQVGRRERDPPQRFVAAVRDRQPQALRAQHAHRQRQVGLVVVDDQDGAFA
nr:hypothetical protein [Duganella sp. BJB1802]